MNTSFIRIVAVFCVAILSLINVKNSLAGNYTWTGSANKNWYNSANWSPSGTPSTNDTVTIGGGSDTLLIAANTTINRLVISGRVVNLGGYQLEISQYASLNGGEIYNGTLILRGALANFAGIHTYCQIDCIVGQLQFNGGVFDGESSFEQNGTTSGYGSGGCVFNAPTIIKKSTNAILRLGESLPDTFNSRVEFICENKVPLEISYGSASVFNDLVSLSCYGANSEIIIGNDTDSVQFSGDAALATGSEGLNDGMILLKKISQSSRIDNELTGAEGFVINIESCTFNAGMLLTAPSILLKNSVFRGDVDLTKTQAASNNYSYGGNSFYGKVTLLNEDGTNALRFANNIGDHFYNDVTFAEGSRRIQMAYAGNSKFEGNVSINNNDVKFNTGNGKVVLSGEKNQTLDGTNQFLICKLEVDKSGGMLQLNQQMTIDSSFTFINGIINTDSTINLKASVNCNGASNLTHGNTLTGIRSDMNTLGCFSLNKIQNMGYSFHFMGNHGQIGFAENEMNYYDHAVFLNNADIGVQGSPTGGAIRTDNNEFIHDPIGLQPDRVIGNTASNQPTSWYYDDSNDQLFNPDLYNTSSSFLIAEQGVIPSSGQAPLQCPEITNPTARNLAFGYIVLDTARYDELYASQFNYHSRQKLYEIIKYNSTIMDMNDSTDVYYESFYNEALESNLAKFESIRVYIESGDYPAAISLVNAIVDTNSIEEVCKYVYAIGINKLPLDSTLSNSDSANYFDIGALHALTTGEAAFITRNNLFYEVHDGLLGGGSRIAHLNIPEPTSFAVALFPIPAIDMVSFTYIDIVPDAVDVSDIGQRCILNSTNIFQLNVASFPPGCYFVRFLQNNKVIGVKKLIKAR